MQSLPSPFANIKGSTAGWAMLAVLGSALLLFVDHRFDELDDLRTQQIRLENHLFEQQAQNSRVRAAIRQLESDPEVIERYARERLGLVRPGEIIYITDPELLARLAP